MKKIIPIISIGLLLLPLLAGAQQYPDPMQSICNILQVIKNILLAIGLGIGVILLIIGGINYITSGGDATKADTAKKLVINVIIGFIIILSAAFILAVIQGLLVGAQISLFSNPCDQYTTP